MEGSVVRLHGLQRVALNGLLALVLRAPARDARDAPERWVVQPLGSSTAVAVRRENLRLAREITERGLLGLGWVVGKEVFWRKMA